jgi:hypothetical protein
MSMNESDTPPDVEEPETTAGNLADWKELDRLPIPEMFAKINAISYAAEARQERE